MGILATDLLIKSMLEAALLDLRANPWILDDIFGGMADDVMSSPESGWKEVSAAKSWFLQTDIPIVTQHRIADAPRIPCVSIAYMPSREMQDRTSLADDGQVEDYSVATPGRGAKAVLKILSNFTPDAYNKATGQITMPKDKTTDLMSIGNFIVAKNGHAYSVLTIDGKNKFRIKAGTSDDFTDCYIAPKSSVWNVHRELTFLHESYSIGCHTQNDVSTTIWLWQIIFYSFLRYKEAFLEGRGFELSDLQNSELQKNQELQMENVFSKYITISGQVQVDWIKFIAPRLESVKGGITIMDMPAAFDKDTVYGDDALNNPPAWSSPDDGFDEIAFIGDDEE